MFKLDEIVAAAPPKEIDATIRLLTLLASDRPGFDHFADAALKGSSPEVQQKKQLLKLGLFDNTTFLTLLNASGDSKGVGTAIAAHVLSRLIHWNIVAEVDLAQGPRRYQFNSFQLNALFRADAIDNVLLGMTYLVRKYRNSVPAVIVEKGGAEQVGTAFVVALGSRPYAITARHNVDPGQGISFKELIVPPDRKIEIAGSWRLSAASDLAAVAVSLPTAIKPMRLASYRIELATTLTLGYPKVSTSDGLYLLAHKGELNAVVRSYVSQSEYLIISNAVAPGSSGSPVLAESGVVIGVVTDAFDGQYSEGLANMKAATPASDLLAFLDTLP